MEKIITYIGQPAKVICDEKCNKAWGRSKRPKHQYTNDPDDYYYLSDDELGEAPVNPGTYEGNDMEAKPRHKNQIGNRWCIRECERCRMSNPGQSHLPLLPLDWSKRRYNNPAHNPEPQTSW